MQSDGVDLSVVREPDIDAALDARIRDLLCRCFPRARSVFSITRAWHGSGPTWTVLAQRSDGLLVGHLGVVDRVIRVAGEPIRVAGVQNVCIAPGFRNQRLATHLLERAHKLMLAEAFDCGLLFCTPNLAGAYKTRGWRRIENTIVLRATDTDPAASLPSGSLAMWLPIRQPAWAVGGVHLGGNDW